jgi:hypothetical protein
MKINGVHRATLGTPPKIQQRRKLGKIHKQNKQHQYQYLPLQQPIDQISATTHTDQHMYSQNLILMHPSQQTTSGFVPNMCSYRPFGARNATIGLCTMTNFMMNASNGKQ